MASLLPPVPRLIFSVVEPISLMAGFCGAIIDPAWFIAEQIPESGPVLANENSIMVAWQLGNLYLLMAFMGIAVLHSTTETSVVRAYLFVLAVGDVGHVGLTAYGMGLNKLSRPVAWNAMTIGNVAFTLFLFVMRSLYFIGCFGPDRTAPSLAEKKEKKGQ